MLCNTSPKIVPSPCNTLTDSHPFPRALCISISTLPSHIYSTILWFAKVTCNTHRNKKLLSIPLKLVPSLAKLPLPYFPPSTGRSASSHSKLVSIFWRRAGRLLCSALSLLSFVAELFMVSRLPMFFITFP